MDINKTQPKEAITIEQVADWFKLPPELVFEPIKLNQSDMEYLRLQDALLKYHVDLIRRMRVPAEMLA